MSVNGLLIKLGLVVIMLVLAYTTGYSNGKATVAQKQATATVEKAQEGVKSAKEARSKGEELATQRGARREAQKEELNEALKAAPDWADARVPDGVWDALGGK